MTSGQEGDLRILLLGKTGAGKSATGNTILGRNAFKETSTKCEKQEGVLDGKTVAVIDTPGLFNTSISKEQVKAEIERCVEMSAPGPHVFLLVIKLGVRFTDKERNSVQWIQENFGKEALLRTIILFTHSDLLKGKSLEAYIRESHYLPKIVESCGGRYLSFNNEDRNDQQQVTKLLQKINALRREHGMRHYTPEMFKTTQTEMTGKDRIKLLNLRNVLSVIILIGVISLGTQQWKNRFQREKDKLKYDILQMELSIEQLKKELRENEQIEKLLKSDLQQKEEEEQQLKNELQQKDQEEKQLRNELLMKESEKQLEKELQENEQIEQLLKTDIQKKEEEEQQLKNELQQKEQEEDKLRNEPLLKEKETQQKNELQQKEKEKWQLKEELLQKEQEKHQLKENLLQKEHEKWQLEKELVQKEQEKHQLKENLLQKKHEKWQLEKELVQKDQETHQLNKNLLQKDQEKQKLKNNLQQKELENQQMKNDLRQKENVKQQLEKKLLQYNQKVQ